MQAVSRPVKNRGQCYFGLANLRPQPPRQLGTTLFSAARIPVCGLVDWANHLSMPCGNTAPAQVRMRFRKVSMRMKSRVSGMRRVAISFSLRLPTSSSPARMSTSLTRYYYNFS